MVSRDSTEVQIGHLRKENEKLRARLAALQQSTSNPDVIEPNFSTLQPIPSLMTPQPEPIEPKEIGIDRTYTSRLHTELSNAKSLLLDKYTELDRVRGREVEEEVLEQRRGLLGRHNGLIMLRAEEGAYNAVLGLLREETAELGEKGRVIAAELEKRGIQVPDKPADPPTEQEVPVSEGVDEETSRAHTQTLAQAVRDVAMTEAREMRTGDEHPGEEDEGVTEKDVYDIQPYIEQAVKWVSGRALFLHSPYIYLVLPWYWNKGTQWMPASEMKLTRAAATAASKYGYERVIATVWTGRS